VAVIVQYMITYCIRITCRRFIYVSALLFAVLFVIFYY